MQHGDLPAYGLWFLAALNAAVFIFFAFSFARPASPRDWRSLGAFSAFVVALFAEMYGFPLTLYLLSGWLQSRYPSLDLLTHDAGHIWWAFGEQQGDPHLALPHVLSYVALGGGFWLLAVSWRVLHRAQRDGRLAVEGPYARLRHPQYLAFILILFGFLLQWPTLLTLLMFPVLVFMYLRLARSEEREMAARFGEAYARYAARTPAWLPHLRGPQAAA